jgi:hypothetical protein
LKALLFEVRFQRVTEMLEDPIFDGPARVCLAITECKKRKKASRYVEKLLDERQQEIRLGEEEAISDKGEAPSSG